MLSDCASTNSLAKFFWLSFLIYILWQIQYLAVTDQAFIILYCYIDFATFCSICLICG